MALALIVSRPPRQQHGELQPLVAPTAVCRAPGLLNHLFLWHAVRFQTAPTLSCNLLFRPIIILDHILVLLFLLVNAARCLFPGHPGNSTAAGAAPLRWTTTTTAGRRARRRRRRRRAGRAPTSGSPWDRRRAAPCCGRSTAAGVRTGVCVCVCVCVSLAPKSITPTGIYFQPIVPFTHLIREG